MYGDVNNDSDIINTTINYSEVEQSASVQYLRWSVLNTKKINEDIMCHCLLIDTTEERILKGFSTIVEITMHTYKESSYYSKYTPNRLEIICLSPNFV